MVKSIIKKPKIEITTSKEIVKPKPASKAVVKIIIEYAQNGKRLYVEL